MKIALCNEVIRDLAFPAQCELAAALGYAGLEVAPFTLADEPHRLSANQRQALRRAAVDAGIRISGLHWLLVTPAGLSLNGPDRAAREHTLEVMRKLVGLCADLGGEVLVHGSPVQRTVADNDDPAAAWARARDSFSAIATVAQEAGVTYCVEPLAPRETNFINTIAEAARMVDEVGSPALRTMIDTSAASLGENDTPADLIEQWLPRGYLAHVQVNDRNRRGPGQGEDRFLPVLVSLKQHNYGGWVAAEPFVYEPDGATTAARIIGYLQGLLETLA